jgi:prepilin-type N-terminal cleavage/methylation domain-containing protein
MRSRVRGGHDGFTLAELLATMAIIAIALVGMAAALQQGLSGIDTGRGESVAVFLVEQKLEELRALALVDWTNSALQPGTMTEYCEPSSIICSPTPTAASLRRTTTIVAGDGAPCTVHCRRVTVAVFYRPITPMGQLDRERRVDVGAMFVARA